MKIAFLIIAALVLNLSGAAALGFPDVAPWQKLLGLLLFNFGGIVTWNAANNFADWMWS